MIRILHTADLHLGAVFAELGESAVARRADQLETFERIVSLALERQVHLLVVAGDLFASPWPSAEVLEVVQAGFRRLRQGGILPVVLPGRSDSARAPDSIYGRGDFGGGVVLDPFEGRALSTLELDGGPLHLHAGLVENEGIAWPTDFSADGLHVGLLHLPEHVPADISPGVFPGREWQGDYLALGGLHDYQDWCADGCLAACCPGSPEGLGFGEPGARYCVEAAIEAGRVTVEKHAVNRRIMDSRQLDVSDCRTWEQLVEQVRALADPDRLLHLILTGRPDLLVDEIRLRQWTAADFRYLEIEDRTPVLGSAPVKELARSNSRYGLLVRKAQSLATRLPATERSLLDAALREILLRRLPLQGGPS